MRKEWLGAVALAVGLVAGCQPRSDVQKEIREDEQIYENIKSQNAEEQIRKYQSLKQQGAFNELCEQTKIVLAAEDFAKHLDSKREWGVIQQGDCARAGSLHSS